MAEVKKRRHAREWAVQVLFQLDMNPTADIGAALEAFWYQIASSTREDEIDAKRLEFEAQRGSLSEDDISQVAPPKLRKFAEGLVRGVMSNREAVDEKIASYARHWPMHRMGVTERNVLRLAVYEMLFGEGVPAAVCINEAVDLAKFFSSTASGRFINGILDRAARDVPHKTVKRDG